VIGPSVFLGPWGYLDQYSLAPGAATAPTTNSQVGGFFYVISGQGQAIISGETADVSEGDAIPILLNDTKQFRNTGTVPLQLMHVGIVSDMTRRNEILNAVGGARGLGAGAPRGGGPGRGAGQGRGAGRGQ
jgi:hypothetical protein